MLLAQDIVIQQVLWIGNNCQYERLFEAERQKKYKPIIRNSMIEYEPLQIHAGLYSR